jgi:hypothetical protein
LPAVAGSERIRDGHHGAARGLDKCQASDAFKVGVAVLWVDQRRVGKAMTAVLAKKGEEEVGAAAGGAKDAEDWSGAGLVVGRARLLVLLIAVGVRVRVDRDRV